jgi:hypothetical protein
MSGLPMNFWTKTSRSDCLIWRGAQNTKGYGCFAVNGVSQLVHRLAWEDVRGPIPDGMTIDHICRVRNCVNVEHLELVTIAENNRRKKVAGGLHVGGQCIEGHDITDLTAYRHPRGHIECRICRTEKRRAARLARAG